DAGAVGAGGGGGGGGQRVVGGGDVVRGMGGLVGVAGLDGGGVAGQRIHPSDERGGGAGTAELQPRAGAGGQGAVVDGDVPGQGGDVGGGAAGAVRVVLPGRFGHIRRAAAARGAPDPLGPAAGVAGPGELGAAYGGAHAPAWRGA